MKTSILIICFKFRNLNQIIYIKFNSFCRFITKMAAQSSKTWTEEEVEAIMKKASEVEELDAEILKRKLKYKVSLERMMKPKQIERKSDYEKQRIQTMEKNLALKYSLG